MMSIVKKAKNEIKKLLGKTPEKTLYENYTTNTGDFLLLMVPAQMKSNLKQV